MIAPFSFDNTVSTEHGRQDRLDLTLDLGKLEGTTNQIDQFRKALSPVPADGLPSCMPSHGWIFERPRQRNTQRFPQEIRSRKARDIPFAQPPLFDGSLDYGGYYRPFMNDFTLASLRLNLNCNPTRFARFSPPHPNGSEPINDPFGETAPPPENGELPTDANDNWIPAGAHDAFYSPTRWRWNVRRYLQGVRDAILADIQTANNIADTEVLPRGGPLFTFQKVETYWEFESPNPVGVVQSIRALMSGFAACGRDTEYTGNCLAIRYKVARGVELCIYAKTDRRVRFEVRHNLREHVPQAIRPKTANTLIRAMRILDACRQDAATVVNRAFAYLRSRGKIAPSQINEALLMIKVGRIIKNDNLALLIVETLRSHGGIAPDNNSATLRRGLERLQYHDILQWDSVAGLYVPTSDYTRAAMTLRSRADTLLVFPKRGPKPPTPPPVFPKRNASPQTAPLKFPKRGPKPPDSKPLVFPKRGPIKTASPMQFPKRKLPNLTFPKRGGKSVP